DFTRDRFLNVYRSDLANSLGNLVFRVLSMTEKYFAGKVPEVSKKSPFADIAPSYAAAFEVRDLKVAAELVTKLIAGGNEYVDRTKPWSLAKTESPELGRVMYELLELLRLIAVYLTPFIPQTAEKILKQLQCTEMSTDWGKLIPGTSIAKGEPLFPKMEV
ncbi:MAG: methionine--tRNA ligase, partial [Patescibacteria group bacterium]